MELKDKQYYQRDNRIVMTLDAGGTNLVFSALQGGEEIVTPVTLPCYPSDLKRCLNQIENGFTEIFNRVQSDIYAISFAFPGPADYLNGIIGDLPNFPAFRGGIALGPYLQERFQIPVYINNDGNLFALGEYCFGFLPTINQALREAQSSKRFCNLLGLTLGTGFGCGIICNGRMNIGDNANGGEIWLMRNGVNPQLCNEGGVGRDKLKHYYTEYSGTDFSDVPEPHILSRIASGKAPGSRKAAVRAFDTLGRVLGDAIANAVTLIDGLIVIGGGLSGAHQLFMPAVMREVNGTIGNFDGSLFPRLAFKVFYLEEPDQFNTFIQGKVKTIPIPQSSATVTYDALPRTGIGISKLGVSKAVALGAYIFALSQA